METIKTSSQRQLLWLGATLLYTLALGAYRLADFPFAVHGDVFEILKLGSELRSPTELFLPSRWWGIPGLMLLPSWVGSQIEFSLVAARLPDVLLGVLSSAALFFFARRSVAPSQAFLLAALIASSPQVLQTVRLGVGQVPPWLFTVLYCILSLTVWQPHSRPKAAGYLLGTVAFLSFFVYLPARVLSVLFALQIGIAIFMALLRRRWSSAASYGSYALIPAAGFLLFLLNSPEVVPRSSYLYVPAAGWTTQSILVDYLPHLLKNSARALGSLVWLPPSANGDFYLTDYGFFDSLTIILGAIGIFATVSRRTAPGVHTPLYVLLLSSLLLGGILEVSPACNRLTTLYTAFALLAVEGWRVCYATRQRLIRSVVVLLALAQISWNITQYFTYFGTSTDRWWSNQITTLAYYLRDATPSRCFMVADTERLGFYGNHGTLRLLTNPEGGIVPEESGSCQRLARCGEFAIVTMAQGSRWPTPTDVIAGCGLTLGSTHSTVLESGIAVTTIRLAPQQ